MICSLSDFNFSNLSLFSSTANMSFFAVDIFTLTVSSPKSSIASWRYLFIMIVTILFLLNVAFIPKNMCLFLRVTLVFPNFSSISEITWKTIFSSTWYSLLFSTCHTIVYCFPCMTLFGTHLLYGFNSKPKYCRLVVRNSYHNDINFAQLYSAFINFKYITFLHLSRHTNFIYCHLLYT